MMSIGRGKTAINYTTLYYRYLKDGAGGGTRTHNCAQCYGKDLESKGEVDSVRWEIEFSKERANIVFFQLAMSSDITEFATKLAMFIGGAIDFIEYNGKRCDPIDRLAFWEQILNALGAAEIRCPQPDQSIETAMDWVELRKKAIEQISTYHHVHGVPKSA